MKTCWPNSKKCSTPKLAGLLLLTLVAGAASAIPARATKDSKSPGSALARQIRADLADRKGRNFESLLRRWQTQHGTKAVPALHALAKDTTAEDPNRYIAVMGVVRLGGKATAPLLSPLLRDRSWMVRTAALRALSALGDPATASHVLPLLKDPALVVRTEAAEAVGILRPDGAAPALLEALHDKSNYRFGKAQWVPQRALEALQRTGLPKALLPELAFLLNYDTDQDLQRQAIRTLGNLMGPDAAARAPASQKPLSEQVALWKKLLASLK